MAIAEILFHEIADGDVRKFNAESNDTDSGGGARDLRFGLSYGPVLDRLFPPEIVKEGGHEYRIGSFCYRDSNNNMHVQDNIRLASPKRGGQRREYRICQLNKVPFFQELPEVQPDDGILFIALIRMTEGLPQMQFLTERQINNPESNQHIAAAMRDAINSTRKGTSVKFAVEMI